MGHLRAAEAYPELSSSRLLPCAVELVICSWHHLKPDQNKGSAPEKKCLIDSQRALLESRWQKRRENGCNGRDKKLNI